MRGDQTGALIAAVSDHHRVAAGMGDTGLSPSSAVLVRLPGNGSPSATPSFGIGVDDDRGLVECR